VPPRQAAGQDVERIGVQNHGDLESGEYRADHRLNAEGLPQARPHRQDVLLVCQFKDAPRRPRLDTGAVVGKGCRGAAWGEGGHGVERGIGRGNPDEPRPAAQSGVTGKRCRTRHAAASGHDKDQPGRALVGVGGTCGRLGDFGDAVHGTCARNAPRKRGG